MKGVSMTKRTVILTVWALALTAACSTSPADVNTSETTPLNEVLVTTDSQSTSGTAVQTGDGAVTVDESQTIDPEGSDVEGLESETTDIATDGVDPSPTNDSIEDLENLDDLLADLDDLLAGLDGGIGDLEDSFDDNEGDMEE
jgi:hypothetical protein